MRLAELARASLSDLLVDHGGWATRTLLQSLRRAMLFALATWQVVQLWALVSTPPGGRLALAVAHVVVLALAILTWKRAFPASALILITYALSVWDWAAAAELNSVLAFATAWLVNLAGVALAFVVPGRRAIALALVAAVLVPIAAHQVNPGWGWDFPGAIFVTQLAVFVATRLGIIPLLAFARAVDRARSDSEQELQRLAVVAATRRQVAEDTRTLHDSVINTLGAIAHGGAAIADVALVRQQCAHDLDVLAELRGAESEHPLRGLREALDSSPIPVRRSGLRAEAVTRLEDDLGASGTRLLAGVVRELLRNAAKHSGAREALVTLATESDHHVITVTDRGSGFDGTIPDGRGLRASVFDRVAELGGSVRVDTTPGQGTTVAIRLPRGVTGSPDPVAPAENFEHLAHELQVRAGWVWSLGVCGVGLVIEAVNRMGEFTAAYAMLACILLATGVAWLSRRNHGSRPVTYLVLSLSAAGAFVLSAAAVDFGRVDVLLWQSLAPAAPLVILFCFRPRPAVLWSSLGLYAATVVALTGGMWQGSPSTAAVIPIAGVVGLGFVGTWASFQRAMITIGAHAAADQRAAFQAKLDSDLRTAAEHVRQRWITAGLNSAVELLRGVAEGTRDPQDASTRVACGAEERYLRQLMGLSPDLVTVGFWLTAAINESRKRGVTLTIRAGDDDLGADDAKQVGRLLSATIKRSPSGTVLTATLFASAAGPQFTLVGPHPFIADSALRVLAPGSRVQLQQLGDLDVLELVFAGPHSIPGA